MLRIHLDSVSLEMSCVTLQNTPLFSRRLDLTFVLWENLPFLLSKHMYRGHTVVGAGQLQLQSRADW